MDLTVLLVCITAIVTCLEEFLQLSGNDEFRVCGVLLLHYSLKSGKVLIVDSILW